MVNRNILTLAIIVFVSLTGCSSKIGMFVSANVSPLEQHHVSLGDGYKATYYQVQVGDSRKTDTVVFFIGGSGNTSLNYYLEPYFEDLDGNVTVYALQKRYVGHRETGQFKPSNQFHQYNHYLQLVNDQKDFINSLIKNESLTGKKIIIFGVSEGGNIAAQLASEIPQVTHLMVLGSGGMVGIDEFRIWGKKYNIDFDKLYQQVKEHPDSIYRLAVGQTYKYWASVLPVNPMDYLKTITIPILYVVGGEDEMMPVESVYFLQNEFKRLRKQNLTVKVYPGCNHVLKDSSGKSHRGDMLRFASKWWRTE